MLSIGFGMYQLSLTKSFVSLPAASGEAACDASEVACDASGLSLGLEDAFPFEFELQPLKMNIAASIADVPDKSHFFDAGFFARLTWVASLLFAFHL
jgi:hypothetical protein